MYPTCTHYSYTVYKRTPFSPLVTFGYISLSLGFSLFYTYLSFFVNVYRPFLSLLSAVCRFLPLGVSLFHSYLSFCSIRQYFRQLLYWFLHFHRCYFAHPFFSPTVLRALCDCMCRRIDISFMSAENLTHRSILGAGDSLREHVNSMVEFSGYPGDAANSLHGIVLAREGFETHDLHRLRVCNECLRDWNRKTMPSAALANSLWVAKLPEHLADSTWVELAAASPVRTNRTVFALGQLKVGSTPGSAQRMMKGTFTFFYQNTFGVQLPLPSGDSDIAGSTTIAFVGAHPTVAQLKKIFGARRSRILELMRLQQDADNRLASEHVLFRRATMSEEIFQSIPEDGYVAQQILESLIPASDPNKLRQKARSTYDPDNTEAEVPVAANDNNADSTVNDAAIVIENVGVVPYGDDISAEGRPVRLRTLGESLGSLPRPGPTLANARDTPLAEMVTATAAAAAGRPPPRPTKNMLVISHSTRMAQDFHGPGTMIAAYFHLSLHAVGGPMDNRVQKHTFTKWACIRLRRRDPRFRKSRTFVFYLEAIIFRREAMANSYWKLTGRVSRGVAKTLASIT